MKHILKKERMSSKMDDLIKAARMEDETEPSNNDIFSMVFNALSKEPYDANMDFSYRPYDDEANNRSLIINSYCNNHYHKYYL